MLHMQPDVFAGFDINLPDLPKFGNVTLPRMYVSGTTLPSKLRLRRQVTAWQNA